MSVAKHIHNAVVLPGAVARGAYEAGVLEVLAASDAKIDRIVATSSGALNGVAYAAGVRGGDVRAVTAKLSQAWLEQGGWQDALHLSPMGVLRGVGASSRDGLLKMLREVVKPCRASVKHAVQLRIVVAPLNGVAAKIGGKAATTYEKAVHFSGEDFDSQEGLERIFAAAAAACAFPGLFQPVDLPGLGPCIDGGAVNNAPLKYALDDGTVGRVYIPVPFPEFLASPFLGTGVHLAIHLVEILINERLFRDLRSAQMVNKDVGRIERLARKGIISAEQAAEIMRTLEIRRVAITEIRPERQLKGGSFSGFFSKSQRARLVQEGREAAQRCLNKVEPEADPHEQTLTE